jgi:hypothetical protein
MSFTFSLAASTCTGRRPNSISKSSGVLSAASEYAKARDVLFIGTRFSNLYTAVDTQDTQPNGESGWAGRCASGRL